MRFILIFFNIVGAVLLFVLTVNPLLRILGLSANIINLAILIPIRDNELRSMRGVGRIIAVIGILGAPVSLLVDGVRCGIGDKLSCVTALGSFFYASIAIGLLSVPFWYAFDAIAKVSFSYHDRSGMPWYHKFMSDHGEFKKQALAFLQANHIMTVSTASLKGDPQVATVYYIVDDDFTLYFLTAQESRKISNLTENKKIAFTMWGTEDLVTIQGGGEAEVLPGDQEDMIARISKRLGDAKQYHWPLLEANNDGSVVVKIKPTWMVWLSSDLDHPGKKSYRYIIS